ncbi:LysR family transcriptional regulator [Herbiconiux moechotypicola]|uniref:LysR family transcriptional regulator n=1 Tax=Herbiconiux moechotypicola TaxID=637393 RepID=A0ABN3DQI5_9MICO|nr:LysR family transcriptional regulator [Herbiconiux moechotypicola]MCS5731437.1 LysR family transcriptional regulator [Herbiconiux moechotypicola]
MDLRQLRQFTAVADARSFTAAAAELGMSQPALSQAIARLERELDCVLVLRNKQNPGAGLLLTPAGESLYADAAALLVAAHRAEERARRAGRGLTVPPVAVGFSSSTPQALVAAAVGLSGGGGGGGGAAGGAGGDVIPVQLDWAHEHESVVSGLVDLAFLQYPAGTGFAGHEVVTLDRVPRVAIVAAAHPLASRAEVTLAELGGEPVLDPGLGEGPSSFREFWLAGPRPAEAPLGPIVGPPARTVEEMCTFVSAGRGMAIASGVLAGQYHRPDLAFVPIAGIEPIEVGVAKLSEDHRPQVLAVWEALTGGAGGLGDARLAPGGAGPQNSV